MSHAEPTSLSRDDAQRVRAIRQEHPFSPVAEAGTEKAVASQGPPGRLNASPSVQAIRQLRQQLSTAPRQGYVTHISALLQNAAKRRAAGRRGLTPAGSVPQIGGPVAQLRLTDLASATVRGWKQKIDPKLAALPPSANGAAIAQKAAQALGDLVDALLAYERTADTDALALALALDGVAQKYRTADQACDDIFQETQTQETDDFLNWLTDNPRKELKRERDHVVRRLNVVSDRDQLLRTFADDKRLGIGEGIRELVDSGEPKIGKTAAAQGADYQPRIATPFSGAGPLVNDVKQGAVGDCWLLAPLISLANTAAGRLRLLDIVQPNTAAELYTVTLHKREGSNLEPVSVTVSSRFAMTGGGGLVYAHGAALWPAIIEKAFAKLLGGFDNLGGSGDGAITAFEGVLGVSAPGNADKRGVPLNNAKAHADVTGHVLGGEHIVVSSATHYYAVIGLTTDGLKLRDPHGVDVTMTWAQLNSFTYQIA